MTSRWIYKELLLCAILIWAAHGEHARADGWSEGDKWRQGAYTVLHTADWYQSRLIAEERHGENNFMLGRYPSTDRVDAYFAGTLVLHYVVAHNLPSKWRKRFQGVTIAVQAGVVAHNWNVGYTIEF